MTAQRHYRVRTACADAGRCGAGDATAVEAHGALPECGGCPPVRAPAKDTAVAT